MVSLVAVLTEAFLDAFHGVVIGIRAASEPDFCKPVAKHGDSRGVIGFVRKAAQMVGFVFTPDHRRKRVSGENRA